MNSTDLTGQTQLLPRFGLTGGIGSGKSTVAGLLQSFGAYVVDADAIARSVLEPDTPGLLAVVAEFGPEVLAEDGSLARQVLAEQVFGNPAALTKLNAITHPRIVARTQELFAQAPTGSVIVHDIPLLVELGMQGAYRAVLVVDCPDDIRVERLIRRGLAEADARARIAAQVSREQRIAVADYVIDNSGSEEQLIDQVKLVWQEIAVRERG